MIGPVIFPSGSAAQTQPRRYIHLRLSSSFNVPNNTETAIVWSVVENDTTAGALTYNPATGQVVVGNGVSKVRIGAGAVWDASNVGVREIWTRKNGSRGYNGSAQDSSVAAAFLRQNVAGGPTIVTAGDTISLAAFHASGSTRTVLSDGGSWFIVEIVE